MNDFKHQHKHEHQHLTPANLRAPFSLLTLSAWQRLAVVSILLLLLWALVVWALGEG
ncbi:hypothetical protein HZU77_004300 [Neisseriaceae bacterium TC5R-5]|nr:hypothetical protein [Neisseriaceae bacterium TC5R-5]